MNGSKIRDHIGVKSYDGTIVIGVSDNKHESDELVRYMVCKK